jgi:hypothetical protein
MLTNTQSVLYPEIGCQQHHVASLAYRSEHQTFAHKLPDLFFRKIDHRYYLPLQQAFF